MKIDSASPMRLQTTDLQRIHQQMRALSAMVKLPLRSGQWRGQSGSVLGKGTGSSVDFQDQRAYLPGDDPRHINWQATARTGMTTMKLFRQEVTPRVDLLIDGSGSMFLTEAKERRFWELVYFCIESTLRLGGALRIHLLNAQAVEQPLASALGHRWPLEETVAVRLPELLPQLPLRQGSLRLLISDLLSPDSPDSVMPALSISQGRPILLVPFCKEESNPDWRGNIDFEECETTARSRRYVDSNQLNRYLQAYQTHFQLWRDQCARHHAVIARIPAESSFLESLQTEAIPFGAVDLG